MCTFSLVTLFMMIYLTFASYVIWLGRMNFERTAKRTTSISSRERKNPTRILNFLLLVVVLLFASFVFFLLLSVARFHFEQFSCIFIACWCVTYISPCYSTKQKETKRERGRKSKRICYGSTNGPNSIFTVLRPKMQTYAWLHLLLFAVKLIGIMCVTFHKLRARCSF